MGEISVKELLKYCEIEVKNGNGDKKVLLSDDDEGNGYHRLFFSFTPSSELIDEDSFRLLEDEKVEDFIVLG